MLSVLPIICLLALTTEVAAQCTGFDDIACPEWKANGYCTNADVDIEQRKLYCGVICGFCNTDGTQTEAGGGPDLTPCDDANPNCLAWNDPTSADFRNFCSNSTYSNSMKLTYCCKTCRPVLFPSSSSSTSTTTTTDSSKTPSCSCRWIMLSAAFITAMLQ